MEHLDRIAESYAGALGESLQEKSRQRIDWICDRVQGKTVLDIGCSQGICEILLGRRGLQVTGIDIAEESIAYAQTLLSKEPIEVQKRVNLIRTDFLTEYEHTNMFDTILLTEILEHLENPADMIEKATAMMASDGKMIVTVPFGINDFPDHKQTFYMANIRELLVKWVQIDHTEFMGEWIGFCCSKKLGGVQEDDYISSQLVLKEEKSFWELERPLRDNLTVALEGQKKAKCDYETMKSWYEDEKAKRQDLLNHSNELIKSNSELQQKFERACSDLAKKTEDFARVNEELIAKKSENESVRSQLLDKIQETARITVENAAKDIELDCIRRELGVKTGENARIYGELIERTAEAARISGELSARNAEIGQMSEELAERKSEVHHLSVELVKKEAEISRNTRELVRKTEEIERTNRQLNEKTAEIDRTYKELAARNEEIAKLQGVNGRLMRERDQHSYQYDLLANAKLGRLTLKYWKIKDKFKARWKEIKNEFRNGVKGIFKPKKQTAQKIKKLAEKNTPHALPSISVIIPTYKDNPYIEKAIDSVLKQDYELNKLQVIVSVNGPDMKYFYKLKKQYKRNDVVEVIHTSKKGAGAARNYATSFIKCDCVTFLDDDDYFTPSCLRTMAERMVDGVSVVFSRMVDYHEETQTLKDNYITSALETLGEGIGTDFARANSLLSTICGKLYRSDLWKAFKPIDESVRNTEDVLFWAQNFEQLRDSYYLCNAKGTEGYIRSVVDNSLSRPKANDFFTFYIEDRLVIINKLSELLIKAATQEGKQFIRGKINAQTQIMENAFKNLSDTEKSRASELIWKSDVLFLNRSKFGLKNGIAFCHNFAPTVDPSAYVAAKRLDQVAEKEGGVNWTVLSAKMQNCRKSDAVFDTYYAYYRYTKRIIIGNKAYFNEKAQYLWGKAAFEAAEKEQLSDVKVMYSRSMWAGSHVAAYLYKQKHPDVKWYAEFSDPLYMDISNVPRKPGQLFEGEDSKFNTFWHDVEAMVYEKADVIIYTNDNQREYMLGYHDDRAIASKVYPRSIVMHHPQLPHRYCELFKADLKLDPGYINIAYFGAFYSSRRADHLWELLKNPRVILHLFVADTGDLKDIGPIPERVQVHNTLPYFEFLNVASKMDYLAIVDTVVAEGQINPFLPSKLADYLTAKANIIAFINENSPLSKIEDDSIVKVQDLPELTAILGQLRKNKTS